MYRSISLARFFPLWTKIQGPHLVPVDTNPSRSGGELQLKKAGVTKPIHNVRITSGFHSHERPGFCGPSERSRNE
jgi:hypothetical protein